MTIHILSEPLQSAFGDMTSDQMSAMIELLAALAKESAPKQRHVPTIEQWHNGMRYIRCGDIHIPAMKGCTPADMPDEIVEAIEAYNKKHKRKRK